MGLFSDLAGGGSRIQATRADYIRDWLTGLDVDNAYLSDAGIAIGPTDMLANATVYRATNVLANAVASVPLPVFKRLPDGGKQRAPEHPSYSLLHDRPNAWMTSYRWRHLMMTRAILWGEAYFELKPGPGAIGQIRPLQPETTHIADQGGDGRLIYVTKDLLKSGYAPERTIVQDDMLHVRGMSIDGKKGVPLGTVARNAIGLALAAEKHGGMFLRHGQRFSGVLTTDASIEELERKQMEASWLRAYGGHQGSGSVPVLSSGLKFTPISANNRDSQWVESRTFQIEELLRFIGVPGVLCGYSDKTATYASAEQFFLSFVIHTVRPWVENLAHELNFSVVIDSDNYFCEFILDALLKGDIKTRYAAHQQAIGGAQGPGWKTRNEIRQEEGLNPGPDELDEFQGAAAAPGAAPGALPMPGSPLKPVEPDDDPEDQARRRARELARPTAERLVNAEKATLIGTNGRMGIARRFASDPKAFRGRLETYFQEHELAIARDLSLPPARAQAYCREQIEIISSQGMSAFENGFGQRVDRLVELALEGV